MIKQLIIELFLHINLILFVSLLSIIWNIFVFALFGIDKSRAIKRKWRISEAFLIGCSLLFGGIGALLGQKIFKHKTQKTKFKIVIPLALIITSILYVHILHGLTLDRIIVYREIDFSSANWPKNLDGYRIAFMTDFHSIPERKMRKAADELNRRELDLLLLGGDFTMNNDHYRAILQIISMVNTKDGIWGVEGNHDDYAPLFQAKTEYGIGILDNSGQHIHPQFFLAGVHDLWNRRANIAQATADANADDFILLVSHNPDITMTQRTDHLGLVLSGHTHGGQITFFGWPVYLLRGSISDYGTRFGRGWAKSAGGANVYTSTGIGDLIIWPRVFSRPEVVIFTMYIE